MQIHELNNFTGTLGSGAYLAIDDGTDTGKISSQGLLAATEARIDNIIAGPAPSAEEIVDARLGADGVTYPSLGDAIRDQFSDVKSALNDTDKLLFLSQTYNAIANWEKGGINADGSGYTTNKRVRMIVPIFSYAGAKVSCDSGYSFNAFVYSITKRGASSVVEGKSAFDSNNYKTASNGYLCVSIGKSDNSDVSTISDVVDHVDITMIPQNYIDDEYKGLEKKTQSFELGGINTYGNTVSGNTYLRMTAPVFMKKGTVIRPTGGYKVGIFTYNNKEYSSDYLIEKRTITANEAFSEYVTPKSGFVGVCIAQKDGNTFANADSANDYVTILVPKLNDSYINAMSLGCVGNGTTDDTDAIQLALNMSAIVPVFFPKGTYLFNKTLTVPSNACVFGDGAVLKLDDSYTLTQTAWRTGEYKYPYINIVGDDVHMSGLGLCGSDTYEDAGHTGIRVNGDNCILDGLAVYNINYSPDEFTDDRQTNSPAWGIMVYDCSNANISNCHVYNCGYENIGTEACNNVSIIACSCETANRTNVQIHRGSKHIRVVDTIMDQSQCEIDWHASFTMHGETSGLEVEDVIASNCQIINGNILSVMGKENDVIISNCSVYGLGARTLLAVANGEYYYAKNWSIVGNRLITLDSEVEAFENAYIKAHADNVLIANNIIDVHNTTNAILINGNKSEVNGNLFIDQNNVVVNTH